MKLRKTMVVLLLLVFAIGMTAFVGCGDKDNRKESEKYELVITDTKNPVRTIDNDIFIYNYDGEEHYPTVVMMYDGKPSDIKVHVGVTKVGDGLPSFWGYPDVVGEYELSYWHDSFLIESENKYFDTYLRITVIIEE